MALLLTDMVEETLYNAKAEDLRKLGDLATEFYASSRFLERFDLDLFVEFWTAMIESGNGIVFILSHGESIVGTLGGVAHRDPHGRDFLAHEFFFFIGKEARGGFGFLKLYRAFEKWARDEKGCVRIQMVHLQDSMPEKLKSLYGRLGFEPAETVYTKSL